MEDGQKKKILFVMASVKQAKTAQTCLAASFPSAEIVHATGSAEAIARCEGASFDLILCDYYMPNLTGLEILRHVRRKGFVTPFVLIVDFQSQGIIVKALRSGADDVVIIDVAFDEILPIIIEKVFRYTDMKRKYEEAEQLLKDSQAGLRDLSLCDELTGLWNRRYMVKKLEEEALRSRRYNRPLSLLLADIDHFAEINRNFGRDSGNLVLQKVANLLARTLRKVDVLGRYEGDEFLIILPETSMEKANVVAHKILGEVRGHSFTCKAAQFSVTLSAGVSWYPRFGQEDYEELLSTAGKALFKAKNDGQDSVKVAGKYS